MRPSDTEPVSLGEVCFDIAAAIVVLEAARQGHTTPGEAIESSLIRLRLALSALVDRP